MGHKIVSIGQMLSRLRTLFLVLGCCSAFVGVQAAETWKVPKELGYERRPLRAEENAFEDWRQAERLSVPASVEVTETLLITQSSPGTKAAADQLDKANQWIRTNAAALKLLDASLRKQKAQAPVFDGHEPIPFLTSAKTLILARLFMADQAAARGDQSTATNLLSGTFKLVTMLRDAEGPAIHYVVARHYRKMCSRALVRWASLTTQANEAPLLREMLKQLPELDDEWSAYQQTMRVEFKFINDGMTVSNIQKSVELARTNEFIMTMQPEELQRPYLLLHDPRLLAQHPEPLDKAATMDFCAELFRKYFLQATRPWSDPIRDTLSVEHSIRQEQFLKDLEPLLKATKGESLPLSEAAAKRAAKHYLKLKNPVGRYQQISPDHLEGISTFVFQSRTERNIVRTLLALRAFELETGKRAQSLDELVAAKLLSELPRDFFADAPLRYSPSKGIVWSIAENGIDDGGVGNESKWVEEDSVWKVPPVPRHP